MNKKGQFGILRDPNGAGLGVDQGIIGTTAGNSLTQTVPAPAFVNASGALIFPILDNEGRIRVTFDGSGECSYVYGDLIGSTSFQNVASATLALLKLYEQIGFTISSATECDWELVHVNDFGGTPVETILAAFMTGPGQYSYGLDSLHCVDVNTAAGTGVQKLFMRGKLHEATGSELVATIWYKEITE